MANDQEVKPDAGDQEIINGWLRLIEYNPATAKDALASAYRIGYAAGRSDQSDAMVKRLKEVPS